MGRKFTFSGVDRQKIYGALQNLLKITDPSAISNVISQIETTGAVNVFGYGSLITTPHTATSRSFDATLHGFRADFVCVDNFYRGTRTNPGLTLGLEKDEEGYTEGVVLQKDIIDPKADSVSAEDVVQYIAAFAKREIPPNMPIYKFEALEVEAVDGTKVLALACVADPDAVVPGTEEKLYVGDTLSPEQKGAILATALGDIRYDENTGAPLNAEPGRRTDYQYAVNFFDARIKRGFNIESELYELMQAMNRHRAAMEPSERARLEALETISNIDPRVFEVSTEISVSRRDLNLSSARTILEQEGFTPAP